MRKTRGGTVFSMAKQTVSKNRDVVGEGCVKDASGRIVVYEQQVMETWRAYGEKLSNKEFIWNWDALIMADSITGPCGKIALAEVQAAIKNMTSSNAAGPIWCSSRHAKGSTDVGAMWVTDVCNSVVNEGNILDYWCRVGR